tara:strand:- start:868 stop:1020 length:153 start_codon:yes stop_codon:yes gene_type:complete
MNRLKGSIILMGVNWSKAALIVANRDIQIEEPDLAKLLDDLDTMYQSKSK